MAGRPKGEAIPSGKREVGEYIDGLRVEIWRGIEALGRAQKDRDLARKHLAELQIRIAERDREIARLKEELGREVGDGS